MATYAGYQRYEVPDIGGNVAKIMMAQNEQNDRRAAQQQANDIRKAKMEADKAKEDAKKQQDYEKSILVSDTKRDDVLTVVPKTGYTSVDGFGSGLATLAKDESKAINDELRKTGNYASFNLKSQSLLSGIKEYKSAYTNLENALSTVNKAEIKSPVMETVLKDAIELFTPTPEGGVSPMGEWSQNGEWTPYVATSQGKQPVRTLNNLAAWANYKPRNLKDEMKKRVDAVGKYTTEVKLPGGGTQIVLDPKGQQNFAESKDLFINSVLASPTTKAEAYVEYVGNLTKPAIIVDKNTSEERKTQLAKDAGYKKLEDANFVEYEYKDGVPIFSLTNNQTKELKDKLSKEFDNLAPYSKSINTPSKNINNINVINNPKAQTDRTRTSYAMDLNNPVGVKAATSGLENAMASGKIARYGGKAKLPNGQLIDASPILVKDKNGQYTGEIKFHKIIGKTSSGNPIASPYKTTINVNNPDDAGYFRIEFGEITDASGDIIDLEATRNKKGTDK